MDCVLVGSIPVLMTPSVVAYRIFNVEVAHYQDYHTSVQGQRLPAEQTLCE